MIWALISPDTPKNGCDFLSNHHAISLLNRLQDSLDIQRANSSRINHFARHALLLQLLSGLQGHGDHQGTGHDGGICAFSFHIGKADAE